MGIIVNDAIESEIEGVVMLPLRQIEDERGAVLHMVRSDSPLFSKFGEVYFSIVNPGIVKAWKKHKRMAQLFAVPVGMITLAIYDDREDSESKGTLEVRDIGRANYHLIKIPPEVWYGFKGVSKYPALVANCTDVPHDPDEAEHRDSCDHTIPYHWQ